MQDNVDEWLSVSLATAAGCMSGLDIRWSLILWRVVTKVMEGNEEER